MRRVGRVRRSALTPSPPRLLTVPRGRAPDHPPAPELQPAPADLVAQLKELHDDAQLSTAQAGQQQFKSLQALKEMFDVLDPLHELLAELAASVAD